MFIFSCSFRHECVVHTKIDEFGDGKRTTVCGNVCREICANVL